MGSKRIYLGREVSKYAEIAGGAILTITALFFVLMVMGFEITGSDDFCLGTLEDPCVSYGKICNLGPDNYDIYNPEGFKMDFSPTIENYWIFFKDGRVKKQFLYEIGINHSTEGWRYENFTDATKPRKDRVYVHRFTRYNCQDYMLVGLKENPNDIIKWGMGIEKEYLDPFWYGVGNETANISASTILMELGSQVNVSANITGATRVCVDIDHPDYGTNYTCGDPNANFLFEINYFRNDEMNDSSKIKNISWVDGGNQTIYISGHQYDDILNLSINITGYETNGTYPTNLKIYVNETLSQSFDIIGSGESEINKINASYYRDLNWTTLESSENVDYQTLNFIGGGINVDYDGFGTFSWDLRFKIPKTATVTEAYMNLSGYEIGSFLPWMPEEVYKSGIQTNFYPDIEWNGNYFWVTSWNGSGGGYNAKKFTSDFDYLETVANTGSSSMEWNGTNFITLTAGNPGNFKWYDEDFTLLDNADSNVYINAQNDIAWNGTDYILSLDDYLTIFEDDYVYIFDSAFQYTGENHSIGFDTPKAIEWNENKQKYYLLEQIDSHNARVRAYNTAWENTKNYSIYSWSTSMPYEDLVYYDFNWYVLSGGSYYGIEIFEYSYGEPPTNPSLEVGIVDGIKEWEYDGTFEQENNRTTNFSSVFVDYLDACTADSDGYCIVPFYVVSNTGIINITDMQIKYIFDQNPLTLNLDAIKSFFENSDGEADLPIRFQASSNGTLEISDIRYDYAGGNDTIKIFTYGFKENLTFFEINTFNNSLSNESIIFSAEENKTRYISLPLGATVNISYLNLTLKETGQEGEMLDGLIGAWSFTDEESGNVTVEDLSGVTVNGTFNGSVGWVDGVNEAGVENFSSSDFIGIPYRDNFNVTEFTLSTWIYLNSTNDFQVILGNDNSIIAFTLGISSGKLYARIGNDEDGCTSNVALIDQIDQWYNLVFVKNSTLGSNTYFYLDGVKRAVTSDSTCNQNVMNFSTSPFRLGGRFNGYALQGKLDEVYFWNRTLNDSEIISLNDTFYDDLIPYEGQLFSYLEIGTANGTHEWNYTGVFNDSFFPNKTVDISLSINNALNEGACDCVGCIIGDNCTIPFLFYMNYSGEFEYSSLNVSYYLINLVANYSNNDTLNLINYYSKWDYAFPSYISWLEFIPKLPTAKNVTPFGQTSSRPMLNITNYGYGGMESNFSVYLNETHSCVNLTMSTTNNKSSGFLLNATWRNYFSDFSYLESQGLWMWADYSCNYTTWRLWEPDISFRNCCEDCVCSEDLV